MEEKKRVGMRRGMKISIFITMILLLAIIFSVSAGETYNFVGGSTHQNNEYEPPIIYPLSQGMLVVQTQYDPQYGNKEAPHVVDTNIFEYKMEWTTDKNGNFNFDLKDFGNIEPIVTDPDLLIDYSGKSSEQSEMGLTSTYIDGTNYIFSNKPGGDIYIDSFSMVQNTKTGKFDAKWGAPIKIDPAFDSWDAGKTTYTNVFKVVGTESGAYLITKQTINNVPTLDISFIPIEELETNDVITPKRLYQFHNNDPSHPGFNPVPDTVLYDALVTSHMDPGEDVIIGAGYFGSSVISWYIGPHGYGQKTLISKDDVNNDFSGEIGSVLLQEGNCPGAEHGVNNISAMAFRDTSYQTEKSTGKIQMYSCDLPSFGSNTWNKVYSEKGNDRAFFMGQRPGTAVSIPVPKPGSQDLWNFVFYGVNHYDKKESKDNFHLGYYASNQLLYDKNQGGQCDTGSNFTKYGNIAIPVGVVDGAVPFSLNNYDCDNTIVLSDVQLVKSNSQKTETTITNQYATSIGYSGKFLKKKVGIDASLSSSLKQSYGNSQEFKQTSEDTFHHCGMGNNSFGYFLYLAPNLVTQAYNVADFYGNPSTTNPEVIYITQISSTDSLSAQFEHYDITNPPASGPLTGLRSAPAFDNFDDWTWNTWSGGWKNRDWTQSPFADNFTVQEVISDDIYWSGGGGHLPSYEMDSATSKTSTVEEQVETTAAILGIQSSDTLTFDQERDSTNEVDESLSFQFQMMTPADDFCGIDTLKVMPVMLIPKPGKYVPWVPYAYSGYEYQPWLLTYDVKIADPSPGCSMGTTAMESQIKTSTIPYGAGTITLPSGGIPIGTTGQVQAVPASGYMFLHWNGYGIDLEDSSSPVTNATVKTQVSTLRAYFGKKSSTLVDTGIIGIQNGSPGNQVKILGTLPSGFNKQVALNLKKPVTVMIGDLIFPFGMTAGDVTIVSDHEIAYTTTDPKNGISHLRVNFGTNKWWFAADPVQNLAKYGVKSHIVNVGIGGKNLSVSDDVLMTGQEDISWSGKDEARSNDVFSLQNATLSGRLYYLNDKLDYNNLYLKDGDLKLISVNATLPFMMRVNGIEIGFDNATSINGNLITYQKTGKDLNATITVNNATMTWNAELNGKQLSNKYWGSGLSIELRLANKTARAQIHPNQTTYLKTQNLAFASFDDVFLSGMNFGA